MGFRVLGLRFGVWGLGSKVWGLWFGVQDSRFRVQGLRFWVQSLGLRVWGLGLRCAGLGLRVWGMGFKLRGVGSRGQGSGLRVWKTSEVSTIFGLTSATSLSHFWRPFQHGLSRVLITTNKAATSTDNLFTCVFKLQGNSSF